MASYTNLNLSRLANAALEGYVKTLLPLTQFSTSFSPLPLDPQRGNVVIVPLVGAITATTFNNAYNVCGGTKTVVTITINKHKIASVGQKDLDALNNSASSLESFGFQQGAGLATLVMEDILTIVTTANFAAVGSGVAAAALTVTELRAGRLALNQANAPRTPRSALIEAVSYDSLLAITNFVQAQMFKDPAVLQEGAVMRALGMDIFEMNASFLASTSVIAFFCHPTAIAVAMRYLEPQRPDRYDSAYAVTDPQTGLTFGLRDHYDPNTGERYINLEANYGFSAGITNGGRVVKRTD